MLLCVPALPVCIYELQAVKDCKRLRLSPVDLVALSPGSLFKDGGRRESLVTSGEKLLTSAALVWRYQSDCRSKPRVHATFCPLSKKLSTQWLVKNSFRMCGRGSSPESPRSKFAVVGCGSDSLTILCSSEFTGTKCITELNTTLDASKTSKIVNSLHCYQV